MRPAGFVRTFLVIMDASELRMGNYYNANIEFINGSVAAKIHVFKEKTSFKLTQHKLLLLLQLDLVKYLEPIPLTEDILLKCGFVKDELNGCVFEIKVSVFVLVKLRLGIDLRERFELLSHDFNPDLNYLHQLQNLYFALTNEELTIEL